MIIVLLSSLGVGGATVFGALIGFLLRRVAVKVADLLLAFAAGVSIGAAILGLVLPSLEFGGRAAIVTTVVGMFCGALFVGALDGILPGTYKLLGISGKREKIDKILIFILAIAIHNLPEGIAAGVGFGGGDLSAGIFIATGIAIQNIPEGMIVIGPLISLGVSPARALLAAIVTGIIEVIGTVIGYYVAALAVIVLPFSLAFAAGTMLYVVANDMLPETGGGRAAGLCMLAGFSLMLVFDALL